MVWQSSSSITSCLSGSATHVLIVVTSALIPLRRLRGHGVLSLFRSLRSFFNFPAANQFTTSKEGKRNFGGLLNLFSISYILS